MLPGLVGTGFFGSADAGPFGAHRYWRVFITDINGGSASQMYELEFRNGSGTDLTGSGTALSGGTGSDSVGSEASKAFDNNATTLWERTGTTNTWIGYDFGSAVSVASFAITAANGGSALDKMPKTFQLEYSDDGSSWTLADGPSVVNGWVVSQTRAFPETLSAGQHRYWRVFVTSTVGGTQTQIVEIEMRATSGGADQTAVQTGDIGSSTGRILASAEGAGNEAYRAFDNVLTTSTGWFVSSGANQYVGYIFPSPVAVQEVTILGSSTTTRSPSALKIQSSDDGTTWTDQKTSTSLSWTAGETKTFSVP